MVKLVPAGEWLDATQDRVRPGTVILGAMERSGCKMPSISTSDAGTVEGFSELCVEHFGAHIAGGVNRLWCGLTLMPVWRVVDYHQHF